MIIDIEKNYKGRFSLENIARDFHSGVVNLIEDMSSRVNPSGVDSLFTNTALEYIAAAFSLSKSPKVVGFDLSADSQYASFSVYGSFVLPFDVQRRLFFSDDIADFPYARVFSAARTHIEARGGSTGFEQSDITYFWFNLPIVKRDRVVGVSTVDCRGIKNGGSYALQRGDPVIVSISESGIRQVSCRYLKENLCCAGDRYDHEMFRPCIYLAAEVSGD